MALRTGLAVAHAADPEKVDAGLMERAMEATVTALLLAALSRNRGTLAGGQACP